MNPLKAEDRKGERNVSRQQVALREMRGLTEMETPKRDRPEAGRPGQRERSQ